mmetsp:Transcript_21999/g.28803  ORF Transcript_21999/g.28803 Transcript_21999/m.28803 type:complete len:386 (+) Transcript_21999:60-1217(+)
MQNLLSQFGAMGGTPAPQSLVTFKAGKMEIQDKGNNKFLIVPDLRKGQISLLKSDDQLIHFQWKDRKTQAIVDDLILFPDDAVFKKVNTGKEGDRVYLLQYKGSDRRFFFWMQDAKDEKDEEYCDNINKYMSDPAAANEAANASTSGGGAEGDNGAYMDLLRGLNTSGAASGGAGGASGGNVQVSDLQSILQSLGMPATSPAAPAADSGVANASNAAAPTDPAANPPAPVPRVNSPAPGGALTTEALQQAMMNIAAGATQEPMRLNDVCNADEILESGVLQDEAVQKQLLELLPEGQQTPEELQSLIRGPQFQQALTSLSAALQGDNFNSVMSNFGIDPTPGMSALARGNGIEAFLQALIAQYGGQPAISEQKSSSEEKKEDKKD